MDPAVVLQRARTASGLSKRALARAAGTSPAAIVLYEQGARDPGVDTLDRILRAAERGAPRYDPTVRRVDRHRNAARLAAVLELAEHLPRRPAARRLVAPTLPPVRS